MMKQAKLETQARLPAPARPLAMPTMSDSAMPTLKKRSGNFLAKKSVRVELCTSPSTTTMSVCLPPASARARPNASRVDLPSFITSVPHLRCVFDLHSCDKGHFLEIQHIFCDHDLHTCVPHGHRQKKVVPSRARYT